MIITPFRVISYKNSVLYHRVPMIKFRYGKGGTGQKTTSAAPAPVAEAPAPAAEAPAISAAAKPAPTSPAAASSSKAKRGPEKHIQTKAASKFPMNKYRRYLPMELEILVVNSGGAETSLPAKKPDAKGGKAAPAAQKGKKK